MRSNEREYEIIIDRGRGVEYFVEAGKDGLKALDKLEEKIKNKHYHLIDVNRIGATNEES